MFIFVLSFVTIVTCVFSCYSVQGLIHLLFSLLCLLNSFSVLPEVKVRTMTLRIIKFVLMLSFFCFTSADLSLSITLLRLVSRTLGIPMCTTNSEIHWNQTLITVSIYLTWNISPTVCLVFCVFDIIGHTNCHLLS